MRLTAPACAAPFAAALALPPAAARAAPSVDPPPPPVPSGKSVRQPLQRDPRLTAAQARPRLPHEAAAAQVERRARTRPAGRFGGAWYGADRQRTAVGVVNTEDADAVRAAGAEPVPARHTVEQLDGTKARLDRAAKTAGRDVHAWYVDVAANTVVVPAASRAAAERLSVAVRPHPGVVVARKGRSGAYGLPLTTAGGAGRIIGWQDMCIDLPNANGVDGQRPQVRDCNGTAAQNRAFPGDGAIRAFGLCMDVARGSTENGAAVRLARCSGNPARHFVLSGAGDRVDPQADTCVDVTGPGGAGTPPQLWECTGGANQKWRLG